MFAKITPCLQNGKHALASGLLGGFVPTVGTTCQFHVVRAGPNLGLGPRRHLFRTLTFRPEHEKCARSFSGARRAVSESISEILRSLPILLPPLAEQRAIAAVLDAIDEAIERTEEVIAATERLRDALLHELLTRGLPGRHSEWADVPGLGTVPACWDVVRLGDVLSSTTYGTNVPLDGSGSTPILRMNNLQGGKIDLSEVRHAELPDRERGLNLVSGDILFNRTNSLDLVGKVAVVRDDLPQPISFASYLVRLRVRESQADGFWLASLLGSPSCQRSHSQARHPRSESGEYQPDKPQDADASPSHPSRSSRPSLPPSMASTVRSSGRVRSGRGYTRCRRRRQTRC